MVAKKKAQVRKSRAKKTVKVGESPKHKLMYQIFLDLGPKRSLNLLHKALPEDMKCSPATLKKHAERFNWLARTEQYDNEMLTKAEELSILPNALSIARYNNILDQLMDRFETVMATMPPEFSPIRSVQDLERVIKLRLELNKLDEQGGSKRDDTSDQVVSKLTESLQRVLEENDVGDKTPAELAEMAERLDEMQVAKQLRIEEKQARDKGELDSFIEAEPEPAEPA